MPDSERRSAQHLDDPRVDWGPGEWLAEVERLQRVIDRAYEAAHEFIDDPHQALVCTLEWLEPAVRPNAS